MVDAVGEPNGESGRAETNPEVDHVLVVLDGDLPHRRVGVGQAPELVGELAVVGRRWVVLERVRVHRVKADRPFPGVLTQAVRVVRIVPRDMQRDSPVAGRQSVEKCDVVDLLLGASGLAADRKPTESGPASPHCPRGSGDIELGERRHHIGPRWPRCAGRAGWPGAPDPLGAEPPTPRSARRSGPGRSSHSSSTHLRNAETTPLSTGIISPVVWLSAPPTRARAALATCSGSTSCLSRVRSA